MRKIYLDNNATTALDPRVYNVMLDELKCGPANPSSIHLFGRDARNKLTKARRQIAAHFDVRPSEIVFTSGGTEALNLVLRQFSGHIISSSVEHIVVSSTIKAETLSPTSWGAITPEQVEAAIRPETRLITLMAANNETGVKTDIETIAAIAQQKEIPFVVDGVALLGKEPFTLPDGVTAICFSAHKFHGPKGIGFAIVRFSLEPQITGGPQERGLRGGTENLAAILGLAQAIAIQEYPSEALRDRLEEGVLTLYPNAQINGEGPRISNTTNIAFCGLNGEGLLMNLDLAGIAVSHGSACSSGSLEPSRVLLNMGYSKERAAASLRFSLSRFTTEEEIDYTLSILEDLIKQK